VGVRRSVVPSLRKKKEGIEAFEDRYGNILYGEQH
jgi:hypothetical protein